MVQLATLVAHDAPGLNDSEAADDLGAPARLIWHPRVNPLTDDLARLLAPGSEATLRCPSGWTGDGPLDPHPGRWTVKAQRDLDEAAARFFAQRPRAGLVLTTHSRHVLHDHHTWWRHAVRFAEQHQGRLSYLIDPAAWFTPDMVRDQADHLERMADQVQRALDGGVRVEGLILANLTAPAMQDPLATDALGVDVGPPLEPAALAGQVATLLDSRALVRAFAPIVRRVACVVLHPANIEQQRELIEQELRG
jgi:hypothetical protein